MEKTLHFEAHGKVMLCGEYFATLGIPCISFPTHAKQSLKVYTTPSMLGEIYWKAVDFSGKTWIDFKFNFEEIYFYGNAQENIDPRKTIISIFSLIRELKPGLFETNNGYHFETLTDFNRNWGLGTSSTLVYLIAQWSNTDPFHIQEKIFGGSGFDVATAVMKEPIVFSKTRQVSEPFHWNKAWSEDWWIIFPGKKQNSRNSLREVKSVLQKIGTEPETMLQLHEIVNNIILADNPAILISRINRLQEITSEKLGLSTASGDYQLKVSETEICKYLGAWGGDMILAQQNVINNNLTQLGEMEKIPWNQLCMI